MTRCEIVSTPVAPGQWRHVCGRCGRDKIAPAAMAVYPCNARCRFLGDPLADEDDQPATAPMPCRGCNSETGEKPYTVWECHHPRVAGGECVPHWQAAAADAAAYLKRPDALPICCGCDHFEAVTPAGPCRTTDNGTAGTVAPGPNRGATEQRTGRRLSP